MKRTTLLIIAAILAAVLAAFLFWKPTAPEPTPVGPAISAVAPEPAAVAPSAAPANPSAYIEVTDSCDAHYAGACVNVRSGPGTNYSAVTQLRNGMVLKVSSTVTGADGTTWYKIAFDEWLRYPERLTSDWYVSGDYVTYFTDPGDQELAPGAKVTTTKRIVVSRSKQMLYAYDGDTLFMQQPVSTGLDDTPTPLGTFRIFRKTPTRYMQGPIPEISDQYYDLPGVPWDMYFTAQGAAVHGAYWHTDFGSEHSHGCVNLPPDQAKILYEWADLGTPVIVQQ